MKRNVYSLIMFIALQAFTGLTMAQQAGASDPSQGDIRSSVFYRLNVGAFNRAMKYNDNFAANQALYNLCVLDPQNDSLLFRLGYRYFESQRYLSAALVCGDAIMLNPENLAAYEVRALSLEQIGAQDKALEDYESLYLRNNNINTLYKIVVLQIDLERYNESKTNLDILLSKKEVEDIKYYFPINENEEQEVPLRAALHNLKGVVAREQGNIVEARKQFNIALEISPDFVVPKTNLQDLAK